MERRPVDLIFPHPIRLLRSTAGGAFLFALLISLLAAGCNNDAPTSKDSETKGLVLNLDSGPVLKSGAGVYKGIPYAAVPTGDRRWTPPQAVEPWREPRLFDDFGPACSQPGLDGEMDEDCLYLNVWTPAANGAGGLPVMVWIHGGAFMTGTGSDEMYSGEALSQRGVVVVTLNYRLGPLGFLAHPRLSAESPEGVSGNYGLLDQIAGLQWVQRNIAQFGGDPQKVTMFGESAGAESVCLLLVSPLAGGVFRSAIAQSPVMVGSLRPLRTSELGVVPAEAVGRKLAERLGIQDGPDTLAVLRATPWERINEAVSQMGKDVGVEVINMVCTPTVDGYVIPDHPVRLLREGRQHPAALLAGVAANESTIFLPLLLPSLNGTDAIVKYVQTLFPADADKILQLLPAKSEGELFQRLDRLITARWFGAWTDFLVESANRKQIPAWLYRFTRKPPPSAAELIAADSSDTVLPAENLGVPHGTELFYVFGFMEPLLGFGDEDRALSEQIMTYWTNFAKTGDPNGDGLPAWPSYGPPTLREYLEIGAETKAGSGMEVELYDFVRRCWLRSAY
jgi:para-nitrobenzyl esterase